ncbi:hypothetical protein ILUMI_03842 [Ignelater luminosus]|uniref:Uncharacterized protein n=1 Tax=Ignelater luminosus TaxID=2038154 RepID=A0A8K0DDX8_IGNLU|nr:hypothetical protein ILUMI_03842 [Ignelater luminosus]
MLPAEPPSIPTPKRMKITDHFPIQNNENSMEERVAHMAAKDGLPLSVFKNEHESIQQGQIDVPLENPEAETNSDRDRSNTTDDDRFIVEVSSSSKIERELISDFNDIINKVRKINSKEKLSLDRDCETRWSSLATMIETFNKLKLCIAQTLIDLGLSTNIEYRFLEHEFCALENLENILKPVKLAVKVICHQDANIIIAKATLKFMIKKLEDNHLALASELVFYHASCDDETFHLPAKNLLRKEIKDFVIRMQFSLSNPYDNNDDEELVQDV